VTPSVRRSLILLLLLVIAMRGLAADSSSVRDGFTPAEGWPAKKIVATGLVGGFLAGSLVSSYYDWWKDSNMPFHFVREGFIHDYSLGIDKIGHAYTAYFYFRTVRNILMWGGFDDEPAFWWGAGASAFFALSVEIGDGVSPYGFSWEDLAGNMAGLGFGMLQARVDFLRNVSFKWSYVPTDGWRWPPRFTDHYDAHTYWLAFNVHNMLPAEAAGFWPQWLQLAVGYGVDRGQTKREFVIGLDLNLEAFSTKNEDLLLVERVVNAFHIPAPAVKFTEDDRPKWYLVHTN
jgi:hypothetical protein